MATTQIKTRILNKISTYAEWDAVKTTFKPMRGEICIVEIPSSVTGSGLTAPAFGMKVGDGTNFFGDLPWIQAIAGDVTAWCKTNMTDYETFKVQVDKVIGTSHTDLQNAIDGLDGRVDALESTVNNATTGVAALNTTVSGHSTSIANLNTEVAKKANSTDVSSEIDTDVSAAKTALLGTGGTEGTHTIKGAYDNAATAQNKADQAFTNAGTAKTQADKGVSDAAAAKSAADAAQGTADTAKSKAETNATAIETINTDLAEIKEAVGLGGTEGGTSLTKRIEAVESTNTTQDTNIKNNADAISGEVTRATNAENALDTRLDKVETFFATAEGETLQPALDTLIEIQNYISGEGSEVQQMIDDIATNKSNISTLQTAVNTTLPGNITAAQNAADAAQEDATTANTEIGKIKDGTTKVKKAETADSATNATNATNATKATQDASGNVITTTYETKTDASSKLTEAKSDATTKANTAEQNAKDYADAELAKLNGSIANGDGILSTVTQTNGKIASSTRRKIKMTDVDETATFVFYCGTATDVI